MRDAARPGTLSVPLKIALDEAARCIQCGFCLPACPTYKVFGEEKHSPRGRIQLVKSWAEGNSAPDAGLLAALDLCLDCRACETACPIDIQYGTILTGARDELADLAAGRFHPPVGDGDDQRSAAIDSAQAPDSDLARPPSRLRQFAFRSALRYIVAVPKRIRFLTRLAHRALHSRVGRWLTTRLKSQSNSSLGAAIVFATALRAPAGATVEARDAPAAATPGFQNASLFLGCAQEGMFPATNQATATLLHRANYNVNIPPKQGCCGALHRHHGDKPFARVLALRNFDAFGAFDESRDDPIVTNAGGCMAWMKDTAELFEEGTEERRAAKRMADRIRDISEILTGRHSESQTDTTPSTLSIPRAKATGRVIYQPSCHLMNVCGISAEPLSLLQSLSDTEVQLPPDGGSCCGSAGIFNALHPVASKAILDAKIEGLKKAEPDVIVTSNPGCHLQMLAGVQAHGLTDKVRVMQLPDFVLEYATGDGTADTPSMGGNTTKRATGQRVVSTRFIDDRNGA